MNYDVRATSPIHDRETFHVTAPTATQAIYEAERHLARIGWDDEDFERGTIAVRAVQS